MYLRVQTHNFGEVQAVCRGVLPRCLGARAWLLACVLDIDPTAFSMVPATERPGLMSPLHVSLTS